MEINRRKFLGVTSAAGLGLVAGVPTANARLAPNPEAEGYRYRLAFNCWIDNVRNEAMPLENWPYVVLDDKTVDGIVRALDLQSESGYTAVDLGGLWTTNPRAWPIDIKSVADKDRQRRVNQILKAAHERNMKVICFPSGVLSWGFDEIIKANPTLRTDNKHEMNPLQEESWQWQYKVFEFVADNYAVDGFHLEAADQGRCTTQECMEKWPTDVSYYSYVTKRMADYLRRKYPNMIVITTVQSFSPWGKGLSQEDKAHLVELSKSVDCLFDQGHRGTYVPQADWPGFIQSLHCAYGTSGGIFVYPPQRWERSRWFLPYTMRTGKHIKELYDAGGRGIMYYQGPVTNPSTEVNIAFGGRMMTNIEKSVEEVLTQTLEALYQPKNSLVLQQLVQVFQRAESVYFAQWDEERIAAYPILFTVLPPSQESSGPSIKTPPPGELDLTDLYGASPGSALYLMEPYLDTAGRMKYKQGLIALYKDISKIANHFNDGGRIGRIKQGIEESLVDINNIAICKGENRVWDDRIKTGEGESGFG